MLENNDRKNVIQNLKDAGCNRVLIKSFMDCYDKKERGQQIEILEEHRRELLHQVHKEERRISCLDYLIYQIQKSQA